MHDHHVRLTIVGLLAIALCLGASAAASPITLYNTGVTSPNNPDGTNSTVITTSKAIDTHYTVLSTPAGPTTGMPNAAVDDGQQGNYYRDGNSNYVNDLGGSTNEPAGDYQYRTTFDLAGFNPSSAAISGIVYCDDQAEAVLLNGIVIAGPGPASGFPDAGAGLDFSASTGFVAGINTLDFIIDNDLIHGDEESVTALDVTDLAGTASVPEPVSGAMIAAGALLHFARRSLR
ncbi:MAG TPA: hypothetical protein VL992_18315, partial [Tepidisphaeraceae bacterium]|nr:hypothetical protein [Tepidisphaeraceae bacterium]